MINFDYLAFVVLSFRGFGCVSLAVVLVIFDIWRFIETRRNKHSGPVDRVWIVDESSASGSSRPPTIIGGDADSKRDEVVRGESGTGIKCYGAGEFPLQRPPASTDGTDLGGERVQCAGCEQCRCNRADAGDAA